MLVALASAWSLRVFQRRPDVQVTKATVTEGAILRPIMATGTLQPVTTVQVGAQISGTIQSIDADFNSTVHAGQMIARLEPALFEAAVHEAEARLGQARAVVGQAQARKKGGDAAAEDARTKLARAEELGARDLIPRADLDAARIAMDAANADLKSLDAQVAQANAAVVEARAAVAQAKLKLDHTVIRSPIEGIIVARNVDVGQTVAASVQAPVLFNIAADLKRMQVETHIEQFDIGSVASGQKVTFEVDSYPTETFEGRVTVVRLQPVGQLPTTPS